LILKYSLSSEDRRDILLSSVLFIFSYPPSPFGFLIYGAFIPQLMMYHRNRPLRSFYLAYITGILINVLSFYWLAPYSIFNFVAISFTNALQLAIFGTIFSYFSQFSRKMSLFIFPFLWTSIEYSRQFGDLAFTWLNIAYTQTYYTTLIQIVDITGYLGITFWICLVNILIYATWNNRNNFKLSLSFGLILIMGFLTLFVYGKIQTNRIVHNIGIKIAYIQPNIDPVQKWQKDYKSQNLEQLISMTERVLYKNPDLVIWPETAIPYMVRLDSSDLAILTKHVTRNNYTLIFGGLDFIARNQDTLRFNSAMMIKPGEQNIDAYHKNRLVPKEEGIPFQKYISYLHSPEIFRRYLYPGEYAKVLDFKAKRDPEYDNSRSPLKVGSLICYESIFPEYSRNYIRNDVDLLAVITNDAWFGYSAQPIQHIRIAVFRAIENRVSIVQCANSGVSAFIDPLGKIHKQSTIFESHAEIHTLPVPLAKTFYNKFGDWPGILSSSLLLISYIYIRIRKRRDSN